MKKFIRFFYLMFLFILPEFIFAQDIISSGQVHGDFQLDAQNYQPDKDLGITDSTINGKKLGMNAYMNLIYTNGNFTAGVRFESYMKPLNGFDNRYEGSGFPYRFLNYKKDELDITVGNFYEQFGNGLIFRTYQEWNLGYDNSLDGVRVKYNPFKGVSIKGIIGTQRYYWDKYTTNSRGIVRGVDAEFNLNDMVKGGDACKTKVILGGSVVSKYQKDDPSFKYKLPENVSAFAGRLNISRGKVSLMSEYAYKINDPTAVNNYIYRDGQALLVSASYSKKGLGITLTGKRIDNMSFKSSRTELTQPLDINFLPPISKQYSYTLSSMYPYVSQPNGEMGMEGTVEYFIKKGTFLGGKNGTNISLNYTKVNAIDKQKINDTTDVNERGTKGYKSDFFTLGKNRYYEDFSVEIAHNFGKKFKAVVSYMSLAYNIQVLQGHDTTDMVYANIGIADLTYKFNTKNSLRLELQYLTKLNANLKNISHFPFLEMQVENPKQDYGNWTMATLEYDIAPKWFFAVSDQFNTNISEEKKESGGKELNYYNLAAGYNLKTTRISLSYGRSREGLLCVGGVCRDVPASNGFTLSISSSF